MAKCTITECIRNVDCGIIDITGKQPKTKFDCSYFATQKDIDKQEKKKAIPEGTKLKRVKK
jgi:hypothetical protein